MEYNDEQLSILASENNEDAKDILFKKYSYIIDIILSKYKKSIYALNIDYNEVKQDANLAFTDALVRYSNEKESSLATFISVCVERKVQNCIRKGDTIKNHIYNDAYSLEYEYESFSRPLTEIIGDNSKEPLTNLEKEEDFEDLLKKISQSLSPLEKDVYNLMLNGFNYMEISKVLNKEPKQIDNTIQRIRSKIKDLL
jgi:RNA polymerase sporulation-specific sigma factor